MQRVYLFAKQKTEGKSIRTTATNTICKCYTNSR